MKKRLAIFCLLVLAVNFAGATNARVESMGKSATFFMDDVSIFSNPANINIYPNFLVGEIGKMVEFSDSNTNYKNQDPAEPFGGGILSFSLNKNKDAETRYPMLCVGAVMNHENELVDVLASAATANKHLIPKPVVPNSDFFLGFTFANGIMIGGHAYAAIQELDVPYGALSESMDELKEAGIVSAASIDEDSSAYASDTSIFNALAGQSGSVIWSSTTRPTATSWTAWSRCRTGSSSPPWMAGPSQQRPGGRGGSS